MKLGAALVVWFVALQLSAGAPDQSLSARDKPVEVAVEPAVATTFKVVTEPEVGSLRIGDRAPALGEIAWVKGEAERLDGFTSGTVYVVEFWATWCAPCIATMPHLSELQREHANDKFRVIAITAEDARNKIEQVRKVVESMGDKIAYPVGFDSSGKTLGAYMTAAAVSTIPCTFLIDREGKLAWVGITTELDGPLKAVLEGTWDSAAFAPKFSEQTAKTAGAIRVQRALAAKDGARLIRETRAYFEATPDDPIEAFSIAACLVHPKLAMMDAAHDYALLDLAIEMLNKAMALEGYRNSVTYSLLARAHSLRGNGEAAVEAQKKAIEVSQEDGQRERLNARLVEYELGVGGGGGVGAANADGTSQTKQPNRVSPSGASSPENK